MRRWLLVLAVLMLVVGLAARGHLSPRRPREFHPRAHALESSLPQHAPVAGARVVVIQKDERVLGLYLDGQVAAVYPIALGRTTEYHKEREGDGRTPEGLYYVCTRNPRSRFHLFLGLSYPNADDADAALQTGGISEGEHRAIIEAIEAQRQPPWNTPLGGEIGLHGGGTTSDWTLGCIALENEAIEELWHVLKLQDPVLIRP